MTAPNILSKIGHGIKTVVVAIGHAFVSLFGAQAAHDFATSTVNMLKSEIGQLALHSVLQMVPFTNMTGDQKRAQAFAGIMQEAEQRGIKVATSTVNLLIELAVTAIKQKFEVQEMGVVDPPPLIPDPNL